MIYYCICKTHSHGYHSHDFITICLKEKTMHMLFVLSCQLSCHVSWPSGHTTRSHLFRPQLIRARIPGGSRRAGEPVPCTAASVQPVVVGRSVGWWGSRGMDSGWTEDVGSFCVDVCTCGQTIVSKVAMNILQKCNYIYILVPMIKILQL